MKIIRIILMISTVFIGFISKTETNLEAWFGPVGKKLADGCINLIETAKPLKNDASVLESIKKVYKQFKENIQKPAITTIQNKFWDTVNTCNVSLQPSIGEVVDGKKEQTFSELVQGTKEDIKGFVKNQYLKDKDWFLKFLANHPKIVKTAKYTIISTVLAGFGYGVYSLYDKYMAKKDEFKKN